MKLLIMGPPGAGKGTQAAPIAEHYGIPAISTGAIFRENVAEKTELGQQVSRILDAGEYVPDELTIALVRSRLEEADCVDGWLLDGFPRTAGQVTALDEMGQSPDLVLNLVVEIEPMMERMLKRALIEHRADDNEATIRHRFEVFRKETQPLIDTYRTRGIMVDVDGDGDVETVRGRIFKALDAAIEKLG